MFRRFNPCLAILLILVAALLNSCTESSTSRPDTRPPIGQTLIKDNAFVVDPVELALTAATDSTLTFTYSGETPDIEVDDVLIGQTGEGYLRRVTSVLSGSSTITLGTAPAELTDAVTSGVAEDTFELSLVADEGKDAGARPASTVVNYTAPGVTVHADGLEFEGVSLLPEAFEREDVTARINSGQMYFTGDLTVGWRLLASTIMEHRVSSLGELEFSASLQVNASDAIENVDSPVLLHSVSHTFVQTISTVPIVEVVTMDIYGGCDFTLQSGLDIAFTLGTSAELEAGCEYRAPNWDRIWTADVTASPGNAQFTGHPIGQAVCYIKPVISVKYYGVEGVSLAPRPYLGYTGNSDNFIWDYEIGSGYNLDVAVDLTHLDRHLDPYTESWSALEIDTAESGSEQIGGIILTTNPPGARILVDGATTGHVCPDTLTYIDLGPHEIRLYLEGFNEHIEDIDYQVGFVTIAADLTEPGYPRPTFSITTPADSAHFNDNVIALSGQIQMIDELGARTPFTGDTAFLTLGGSDQILEVNNGYFSADASIFSGENDLSFRATADNGQTGVSEPMVIFGDFVPDDIVIQLSWNGRTSDIDLHVWNPRLEHCFYGNMQVEAGSLDIDDVNGYGPETFTSTEAIDGPYVVKANAFVLNSDTNVDATVSIWLNGAQPSFFGPHEFTVADMNGSNPEAWWQVEVFWMGEGAKMLSVRELSPEDIATIEAQMQDLPPKR